MATLLLTAIGTAIGGPIGGAIGALAGRQLDGAIFGPPKREGPRLQDLKITTSSYGQPIPWHFGKVRAAGTVIWATDLKEHRESSGGGKGKPKVTSYSYSASFAVALASRPIDSVGRIWADGNLLRGAAGDLKTGGTLRIHKGWGDQPLDPLIAAAEGASCPAFRNCAYAVFEDLQLADFGNRIPALSFEIFAGDGSTTIVEMTTAFDIVLAVNAGTPEIQGFTWDEGSFGQVLSVIDDGFPLIADASGERLTVTRAAFDSEPMAELSEPVVGWDDGDFGQQAGFARSRETAAGSAPSALRYYDIERDYLVGTQRSLGRADNGQESMFEFPGTMNANSARMLIEQIRLRHARRQQSLAWRIAELDTSLAPGTTVAVSSHPGNWRIRSVELREKGIELELAPAGEPVIPPTAAETGRAWSAPDLSITPTQLRAFELPFEAGAPSNVRSIYAAASSTSVAWAGATLFAEQNGTLLPLELSARNRAISGILVAPLPTSSATRLDPISRMVVELADDELELESSTVTGLAFGANRLLVGDEIIQFMAAHKVAASTWELAGILRGRGGSENAAMAGHPSGTPITLIDGNLVALDASDLGGAARIAAIGLADDDPVYATIENPWTTLRPLTPVHPRMKLENDGSLSLGWTRRARGAWAWDDDVDVPLVEQQEAYRVGVGLVAQPIVQWEVSVANLSIQPSQYSSLLATHSGTSIWVRQVGTHAQSDPLLLGNLN